jgi:hypothetical protein
MKSHYNARRPQAKASRDSIKNLYFRLFLLGVFIPAFLYLSSSPLISSLFTKQVRTKWYNEDLQEVFGVTYLPYSIDDPEDARVSEILDAHDIRTDENYRKYNRRYRFEDWASILSQGPSPNDKRIYIAEAGEKGHGVFAGQVLKAGEYLAVYTGIHVLKDRGFESSYQWSYASKPMDENGDEFRFNTDAKFSGNILRFVNDNPGSGGQNCNSMKVCF